MNFLWPKEYLIVVRSYLIDLINEHEPTVELNNNNNKNNIIIIIVIIIIVIVIIIIIMIIITQNGKFS